MDKRFFEHLAQLQARTEQALSDTGFNGLLIGSGPQHGRFLDDTRYPFRANPHFVQWLPFITEVPECWLLIRPTRKPLLLLHSPDDFWHATQTLPQAWWCDGFEIEPYQHRSELVQALAAESWLAVINEQEADFAPEDSLHNPPALIHQLNFGRAAKTDWELHCLREANRTAVKGHVTAERLFHQVLKHSPFLGCRCIGLSNRSQHRYEAHRLVRSHGSICPNKVHLYLLHLHGVEYSHKVGTKV